MYGTFAASRASRTRRRTSLTFASDSIELPDELRLDGPFVEAWMLLGDSGTSQVSDHFAHVAGDEEPLGGA